MVQPCPSLLAEGAAPVWGGAGVEFAFFGHQVGDGDPWLGADPTDALTFLHPTSTGQAVYRAANLGALAT